MGGEDDGAVGQGGLLEPDVVRGMLGGEVEVEEVAMLVVEG